MGTYEDIKKRNAQAIMEMIELRYLEALDDIEDESVEDWDDADFPEVTRRYAAARMMYLRYPQAFVRYFARIALLAGDDAGAYMSGITAFLTTGKNYRVPSTPITRPLIEGRKQTMKLWHEQVYDRFAEGEPHAILELLLNEFEEVVSDILADRDDGDDVLLLSYCRNCTHIMELYSDTPDELQKLFAPVIFDCRKHDTVNRKLVDEAVYDYLCDGEMSGEDSGFDIESFLEE